MDWRLTEPYDPSLEPAPEMVACDHCETLIEDGTGNRLGRDYVCSVCYGSHPVVIGYLMAALKADERRDGK